MTQADKAAFEQKLREAIAKIDEINATLENAIIEPEPKATGWAGKHDENYGRICSDGRFDVTYAGTGYEAFRKANKFTDDDAGRAKAEEVAAVQLCYRLLKRFSDENGGEQIDWGNHEQYKHSIYYNAAQKTLAIDWDVTDPQINVVYFASEEIAQQAIALFRPQIMAAMGIKEDA
jgi:hypothetical protein